MNEVLQRRLVEFIDKLRFSAEVVNAYNVKQELKIDSIFLYNKGYRVDETLTTIEDRFNHILEFWERNSKHSYFYLRHQSGHYRRQLIEVSEFISKLKENSRQI